MAKEMIDVIVRSGVYLERCKDYHEEYVKNFDAIIKYVESIGGDQFFSWPGRRGFSVRFKHTEGFLNSRRGPEGWSSPDRKRGICTPKKPTRKNPNPVWDEVHAFEPLPGTWPVYVGIPLHLNFHDDQGSRGWSSLVPHIDPSITYCTIDGEMTFFMEVPDYKKIIADKYAEYAKYHPGQTLVIDDDLESFTLPEGLEPISPAKYNYLFALSKLQAEEEKIELAAQDYAT